MLTSPSKIKYILEITRLESLSINVIPILNKMEEKVENIVRILMNYNM